MFQSPLKLGSPEPFLDVPGEAEMTLRQLGLTPETNRDYQRRVHSMDYDGDERTDLVFWNGASFDVHLQESSGQFRLSATEMAVQGQFDFDGAYGVLGSYQDAGTFGLLTGMRKRSSRTVLHAVRDMDGDGVADLVTLTFSGRSLLRQRMTLSVYKGRRTAGRTVIEPEALATLALPGSPTALTYATLTIHDTDDGDALLMYHHVSTSPLQFARVVLGRRLKTTVYFYQLKQGELSATPDRILPLKGPGFPVLLLGDLTGDGSAELMVTQVRDSIQIYGGVPQNLWDTEAESVSFDMHRYEGNTWLVDIGPGKRKGLVGWRPSETNPNRVSVLMDSDGTL